MAAADPKDSLKGGFTENKDHDATNAPTQKIYECLWTPPEGVETKALVILQHGLHEHMGRYHELAGAMAEAGCLVAGHDHMGHGQTDGLPGYVPSWEDLIADAVAHAKRQASAHPGLPVFSMGHSMGGLVAATLAMRHKELFKACLLSAPLIEVDPNISGVTIFAAKVLSWILPRMGVEAIELEKTTSDVDILAKTTADPLHFKGKVRARTGSEMLGGAQWAKDNVKKMELPLLVLHGEGDEITNPRASKQFVADVSSEDKKYIGMPGLKHEIFNEIPEERAKCFALVLEYLERQIAA